MANPSEVINLLRQYNYWTAPPENLGYLRKCYLDSLSHYFNNNLIKVLIGQRRAGKSYLLRQLIAHLTAKVKVPLTHILYINFEIEKFSFIRTHQDLRNVIERYIEDIKPTGKIYFFFDEIQEVKDWEKLIVSYQADPQVDVEIVITGSNSTLLSSELATHLSGRYVTKVIYPFSFSEYLGFYGYPVEKGHFLDYLKFSGIPELYNLPDEELRLSFVEALKDTIFLKDIVQRYKVQHPDLLEKIFLFLVDNIGNLFSLNALVKKLKNLGINSNTMTLGNYLKYIENAFLLQGIDRYDLKGKKILEGEKKYYLNDLSFRNFLSSGFDPGAGKKLENYVFNVLRSNGYKVYVGCHPEYEIDFVAEKQNKRLYVQVAYLLASEEVIEREYRALEKIKDHWEKMVVSLDDISLSARKGIKHIQAWNLTNAI